MSKLLATLLAGLFVLSAQAADTQKATTAAVQPVAATAEPAPGTKPVAAATHTAQKQKRGKAPARAAHATGAKAAAPAAVVAGGSAAPAIK